MEILSQDPDIGESKSSLPIKGEGDKTEISFNHKFILDGLSEIKSSEISFELNGEEGPGVLKPVGRQDYVYLVMPVKGN